MAADGGPLPNYARVGAELEDPQNGDILAIYGGGRHEPAPRPSAHESDCHVNTAVYAREQVGSSFKPYVLSEAVLQGMNVKTSTLNGNGPLYVPPDHPSADATHLSTTTQAQALTGSFPFNNDGDESLGPLSVLNAFAQSSNTAFTDLAHRVGTQNIIKPGVGDGRFNLTSPTRPSALAWRQHEGDVGLALGTAALTVNEQDTMLSTIDNGGTYHQGHVIVSVTSPTGTVTTGKYAIHEVLNPAQDSQVQYAMSTVVQNGTAAGMIDQSVNRPVIAKTGTTTSNRTAFFIGAIPQYALSVGIFTKDQGDYLNPPTDTIPNTETLDDLGNNQQGGFGGYWPAKIWNTFADKEFASLPVDQFLSPEFGGQTWDQVPKAPAKKKTPKPAPTQTCKGSSARPRHGAGESPDRPSPRRPVHRPRRAACSTGPGCQPTSSVRRLHDDPEYQRDRERPSGRRSTHRVWHRGATAAVDYRSRSRAAACASGQASLAIGGVLSVLPGSLVWTRSSRRRRRRRRSRLTAAKR